MYNKINKRKYLVFGIMSLVLLSSSWLLLETPSTVQAPPGDILWEYWYGDQSRWIAHDVVQTADGGFAMVGEGRLLRMDSEGNQLWVSDWAGIDWFALDISNDGGFILAGCVGNSFYDLYNADLYILKTDADGHGVWSHFYNSYTGSCALSIIQTSDDGYILAGYKNDSYSSPARKAWVMKYNSTGGFEWEFVYGLPDIRTIAHEVIETKDGGYAVAGAIMDWTEGTRHDDVLLIKLDNSGGQEWVQTWGSDEPPQTYHDVATSLIETTEDTFVITGETNRDVLITQISQSGMEWMDTWGGINDDRGTKIIHTAKGNYAIAGWTQSYGVVVEGFLLEFDSDNHEVIWNRLYGGYREDHFYSALQVVENGFTSYVLVGSTESFSPNVPKMWILKTVLEALPPPGISLFSEAFWIFPVAVLVGVLGILRRRGKNSFNK